MQRRATATVSIVNHRSELDEHGGQNDITASDCFVERQFAWKAACEDCALDQSPTKIFDACRLSCDQSSASEGEPT
jgi:hypothetical protein